MNEYAVYLFSIMSRELYIITRLCLAQSIIIRHIFLSMILYIVVLWKYNNLYIHWEMCKNAMVLYKMYVQFETGVLRL